MTPRQATAEPHYRLMYGPRGADWELEAHTRDFAHGVLWPHLLHIIRFQTRPRRDDVAYRVVRAES